ncbi:transmembrane protein 68-like isoform X1 [Ctenocephalides felis]|uniref:transmembrane protein 68-like isoform X1 n=1 Tax=Ctenocephalides felis TaxID=7515 RepID=UPI000E6E4B1A|nr:transmembrane protein 68-like isoform X1 [Ctenocephalides felis]
MIMIDIKNSISYIESVLENYIDLDYSLWLYRLLTPLLITFLLPAPSYLCFYMTSLILYIYKLHRHKLKEAYESSNRWAAARNVISVIWDAHGWLWHGFEIDGIEKIPCDGPALIIYYHGAIPIDIYYFMARVYLKQNRVVHTVADRFLFKIPGWSIISEAIKVIPGTIQQCSNILQEGNLLAISPGGVYEAQFGSHSYKLMWNKRVGFAKVALDAKVPIIPLFTENVREAFRTVGIFQRLFLKIYSVLRIPLAPIYGGFPVKLLTHVCNPIPYDGSLSPEELQIKVAKAIDDLILEHQRLPGNILLALKDRFIRKKIKY